MDVIESAPNRIQVKGALTFETARSAHEAGLKILRESQSKEPVAVDCSGVDESDSAGLAVLIDWLANARAQGRRMHFSNLPAGILAAARISDVESMLEIQPAAAG